MIAKEKEQCRGSKEMSDRIRGPGIGKLAAHLASPEVWHTFR